MVMCFGHSELCPYYESFHVKFSTGGYWLLFFYFIKFDHVPDWLATLPGLPQSTTAPLHLVFELRTRRHVTRNLLQLQWPPICWQVQFKLCCLMHSIFHGNLLQRVAAKDWMLEFLTNPVLSQPADPVPVSDQHFPLTMCCRAYRTSSASVLSHTPVPQHGTHCPKTFMQHQTAVFGKQLKTHYFSIAVDVCWFPFYCLTVCVHSVVSSHTTNTCDDDDDDDDEKFTYNCVVIRLAKEKVSYEQEADKQLQKIDNMKAGGEDEYIIKKQVRLFRPSRMS